MCQLGVYIYIHTYIHIHIYVIYTGCTYLYIVYIYVIYLYRGPSALRNALLPADLGRTGQLGVFATLGGSSGSRRGWPNIGPLRGGL